MSDTVLLIGYYVLMVIVGLPVCGAGIAYILFPKDMGNPGSGISGL